MNILKRFVKKVKKYGLLFKNKPDKDSKFVDLAPTSNADEKGIYFEALQYATDNPNVYNIALTGPYGSGKSSVIKSFLTKYSRPVLQISLASFKQDVKPDVNKSSDNQPEANKHQGSMCTQEIERSILQQMLYGAEANKLPLSRFKRIQSPKWRSWVISLFVSLGCFAVWYLFHHQNEISSGVWYLIKHQKEFSSGNFLTPLAIKNWINISVFLVGFIFVWLAIQHLYIKSFGLSLKSLSLKDLEIAPEAAEEESILNRHLDEIVYFFQSTKYDLVIIEDLDRFDNPDIFVTLREINYIVNSNVGVKRTIRFLYALRDDMFINTERTKFFEFIIPVLPIINYSNSIDKVLEQGQRLSLVDRLNSQFLRDVSRYLNDLRLIHNVFNEYSIYSDHLSMGDDLLDSNKLLAVLIYKNVMPNDFEQLHQQKGVLADILSSYDELISRSEIEYKSQISKIESETDEADKQLPKDIKELRSIYAMAMIDRMKLGITTIEFNSTRIPLSELSDHKAFEDIISSGSLNTFTQNGQRFPLDISIIESEVYKRQTYSERKLDIERKSSKYRLDSIEKVLDLKAKIASLRTRKFNEIIRENATQTEDIFSELGDNSELLKFLIFEGYLDDTYHQYISLFHSGRLSPNDNNFLIQIRGYKNPSPDFRIDNPEEVVAAMRDEDFSQEYVLNQYLMDYLLKNRGTHFRYLMNALRFISNNFTNCEWFILLFYLNGKNVSSFISAFADYWPEFTSVAIQSKHTASHVARILAFVSNAHLKTEPDEAFVEYVSTNLDLVLRQGVEFKLKRLKLLNVEITNLKSISAFSDAIEYVTDEALYAANVDNIRFIYEQILGHSDVNNFETKHFTTILSTKNEKLIVCIENDFLNYLQLVLEHLEINREEEVTAVQWVLNHEDVESQYLKEFLAKQTTVLPTFENVPLRFYEALLEYNKIEPTWENCLTYIKSENFAAELLTTYLEDVGTMEKLSTLTIPDNQDAYVLRKFLIDNNDLELDTYRGYIQQLPWLFAKFSEELNSENLDILIEERKITFSTENFEFLEEHSDLQIKYIVQNIDDYLMDRDNYTIDDNFRTKLLESNISDNQKLSIIQDISPSTVTGDASCASIIGPILNRMEMQSGAFDFDYIKSIIINTEPITAQVSLFNKYQQDLVDGEIIQVLGDLPKPYTNIAVYGKSPVFKNTSENIEFASWLEDRKIISSVKIYEANHKIRIYTFNKKR